MHKRGHMPSCGVCLSVLLSATFVYCVKMHNNCISKIFSPSDGHTILVFTYHTLWQYSDGNPVWMVQKSRFSTDIWLWDRWLVECSQQFQPWSKVYHNRRWRQSPRISEPCLWQRDSTSLLSTGQPKRTEQNLIVDYALANLKPK